MEPVFLLHSIDAVESKGLVSFSDSSKAYNNGTPEGAGTIKTVSFRARAPLFGAGIGLSNSFDKPILILLNCYFRLIHILGV
jgi:hypothetical protein